MGKSVDDVLEFVRLFQQDVVLSKRLSRHRSAPNNQIFWEEFDSIVSLKLKVLFNFK